MFKLSLYHKLSQSEQLMFTLLGYGDLLASEDLEPITMYRIALEDAFLNSKKGPGVESLRRCYKALTSGTPHRLTPAFDALIEL